MKELKEFCVICNEDKDILRIERVSGLETIELSCGHKNSHRYIEIDVKKGIGVSEQIGMKHKNSLNKLLGRYKTKISAGTKRHARDELRINREKGMIIHKVWEQNQNEQWILVHDEKKPFPQKNKKN